jgi:membrane fusion protein
MSTNTLFRSEALEARSTQWLGSVRLTQPISYYAVATVGLAVAALVGAFGYFGSYTKKATVIGMVSPSAGVVRISNSSGTGALAEVRVREGQTVAAGEVLFVISSERVSDAGATQALIGAALRQRVVIAQRDAQLSERKLAERIASFTARIAAIENDLSTFSRDATLFAERERIARSSVERFEKLSQTGFTSAAQTDTQREQLLALQAQQQALARNETALKRERDTLIAQIAEAKLQAQAEASEHDKARALLSQDLTENQARTRLVITAQQAGVITGLSAQPGQTVSTGMLLATLLPAHSVARPATSDGSTTEVAANSTSRNERASALEAHFFATTRQAGFVEAGQAVRIRYPAYPYQKFGMGEGVVTDVSRSPYAVQELPTHVAATLGGIAQTGDAVYRVTVKLKAHQIQAYGQSYAIKAGMLAEADILQDTRALWEWALEPIFSVSGKIAAISQPDAPTLTAALTPTLTAAPTAVSSPIHKRGRIALDPKRCNAIDPQPRTQHSQPERA